MNHTKEPWEKLGFIVDSPVEYEANQERMILCVNKCAGITNKALEEDYLLKLKVALEETSESLEFALGRLGVCLHGDGADHKADTDDWGACALLDSNKDLLKAWEVTDDSY